jgi:hypothetical protein
MNKNQYVEFHKYLAMMKYDEIKTLCSPNLSEESRKKIEEEVEAIDLLMKVIIFDDKN